MNTAEMKERRKLATYMRLKSQYHFFASLYSFENRLRTEVESNFRYVLIFMKE